MSPTASHLVFAVTNDLSYDQRMQRICGSLAEAGYRVTLIGCQRAASIPLKTYGFEQVRLPVLAEKGKLFYLSYNRALYQFLVRRANSLPGQQIAFCAIDLDTAIAVMLAARKMQVQVVYDAHELFTELTEVRRRPLVYAAWQKVEQWFVPKCIAGYTVNEFIAKTLQEKYKIRFDVLRNLPVRTGSPIGKMGLQGLPPSFFLYQGAVNEGRGFDQLLAAMPQSPLPLVIAGDGNYMDRVKQLVAQFQLENKVLLLGMLSPNQLRMLTPKAYAGITIFENSGLNQYYSLANRFFDYIQAGIPQLCIQYPEYEAINSQYEIALMVENIEPESLLAGLNKLVNDPVLYQQLKANTGKAALELCWEEEEKKLLHFWTNLLPVLTD
jgi:glycosyltransferase involved in cell wall biosynthesis